MKIQRSYRHPGDYDHVSDYLAAVEAESCLGCEFSDPAPGTEFPSGPCLVAAKVWDEGEMPEWTETEAPTVRSVGRIRCSARRPRNQGALLGSEEAS